MSEAEWLASEDPAAMLRWVQQVDSPVAVGHGLPHPPMSVRKLRLFAAACYWDVAAEADACSCRGSAAAREAESWADGQPPVVEPRVRNMSLESFATGSDHAAGALQWSGYHRGNRTREGLAADQAALLRDIAGNPFRPVTLPSNPDCLACHGSGTFTVGNGEDAERMRCRCCPWLTPTVVSLAQAAYDQRQRKCDECHGTGNGYHVRDKHISSPPEEFCPPCRGTGTVDDGTLDPVRLAILADALEEAGCVGGEDRTESATIYVQHYGEGWHVMVGIPTGARIDHRATSRREAIRYAEERFRVKRWQTKTDPGLRSAITERSCWGQGLVPVPAEPHPILAHLRSPGPHVRGCWAVDLILGRE